MFRTTLAGAAATALLALPAGAATVVATYTGTVSSSYDLTGVFGGDPTDAGYDPYAAEGQDFTLTYTFDTTLGTRETQSGYDQLYGGSYYGTPSLGSAALTIGGVTQSIAGDGYGYAYTDADQYYLNWQDYSADPTSSYATDSDNIYALLYDSSLSLPADLEQPFSISFDPNSFYGGFSFLDQECDVDRTACTVPEYAYGLLAFDTLIVTVDGVGPGVSPVPLPASGLLLLAGLGGVGLVRRRRA